MATDLKSPQQQLFDAVFAASLGLGYQTFDYLPANKVSYPFVFLGEQSDQDRRNKSIIYGDIQQTIHIYHDYKKRRELTTMMDKLKVECRKLKHTENFNVTCKHITSQTIPDNSTAERLWHGIIEAEFTFN